MSKFPIWIALATAASILPVRAEPSLVISLETVNARIRAQNPDLAAARLRIREAAGRLKQSGRLANPEIEASVSHNPSFRERSVEIGFSQRFPVTNRLRLEKAVSAVELEAAEAEVRDIARQLSGKARESMVRILAIRARRELLKQQSDLYGDFSRSLEDASKKGEGSAVDAGLARLEAASLTTESRQLDAEEAAEVGVLKPLLGMLPTEGLTVSGSLSDPGQALKGGDINHRPDLQAAVLDAQAARQGVMLEKSRTYEDVEAGVFTSAERTEDAPEGYRTEGFVGLRVKIPLPLWNKNEGAIDEARARHERKELETEALARSIRLEAEAARNEMDRWAQLTTELHDTLQPLAQEQSELAETAYRGGQGEIQSVLRAREKRLQLAAARLDALREYHLARVRYLSALGEN